jgi:uncharacterized protein HemX
MMEDSSLLLGAVISLTAAVVALWRMQTKTSIKLGDKIDQANRAHLQAVENHSNDLKGIASRQVEAQMQTAEALNGLKEALREVGTSVRRIPCQHQALQRRPHNDETQPIHRTHG